MPHTSGRARARCEDARRTAPTVIAPVSLPTIRYVTAPRLSVIVLVYNEAESIAPLYEELSGVLEGLDVPYEIVYVDDGSRDGSTEKMAQLALRDSHLRVVSFRRNFGQTAAVQAGIDNSTGEILIFMDGDMQNDPHDIPRLLDKIKQGDDVVSGWRKNRQLAHRLGDRRSPPRFRLHAQGLPARGDSGRQALRRDAPVHPGVRVMGRRPDLRVGSQPPQAVVWELEILSVANVASAAGLDDREAPGPVFDQADLLLRIRRLWPVGVGVGVRHAGPHPEVLATVPIRPQQPAAAAGGVPRHRGRAVHPHGVAGGIVDSHLSRIAGQVGVHRARGHRRSISAQARGHQWEAGGSRPQVDVWDLRGRRR